jgi:hypothetical protein
MASGVLARSSVDSRREKRRAGISRVLFCEIIGKSAIIGAPGIGRGGAKSSPDVAHPSFYGDETSTPPIRRIAKQNIWQAASPDWPG